MNQTCLREGCGRRIRKSDYQHCSTMCRALDTELTRMQGEYEKQPDLSPDVWADLVTVCDQWTQYQRARGQAFRQLR